MLPAAHQRLAGLDPRYLPLAERLLAQLESDERVRAVLLTGSLGDGTADRFSDLDLTVATDEVDGVADAVRAVLADAVYLETLPSGAADRLLTAVTPDWLRVDVLISPPARLAARNHRPFTVVIDRAEVASTLGVGESPAVDVRRLTESLLRIIGLLDVVVGRGEYVVAARGVPVLQDMLVELCRAGSGGAPHGGIKHLSRDLSERDYTELAGLPAPVPERESVIAAQLAVARAFLPRARNLLGDDFPTAFADATRAHLRRTLGVEL